MVSASLPQSSVVIYDLLPAPGICPYAQRAKIVLHEKSIPHKVELFDKEQKPQDFLDLFSSITANPKARATVPTIIDGDVKLTESHVVSEYLDNAYPAAGSKLFPTEPQKLAKVRLFVELFAAEVQPNIFKFWKAESQEELDAAKEGFTYGLKTLDTYLSKHGIKGGDFLLGQEFSYAEAATLPFVYRFNLTLPHFRDIDPLKIIAANKLTNLEKWIKAGLARASIKDTLPEDEAILRGPGKLVKAIK